MKRIFAILALVALVLTSCEDTKPKNQPWDPNAMISLRPAAGVKAETNPEHLSALEIVKQTESIRFWNRNVADSPLSRGFADSQRDYDTPKLLMWGTDIIDQDGIYVAEFIEAEDIVLATFDYSADKVKDTIAYIPNQVLRDAQKVIKAAYDVQDYETCYAEFDKAFTFTPITGAEWRELKATGNN